MLRYLRFCCSFLFVVLPALGFAQTSPIGFPDPTQCASVPDAPQNTMPTTPGRWWNPQRPGTGWDLGFTEGGTSLYLTWFTYDATGRPTWYVSWGQWQEESTVWAEPLYRFTFAGPTRVGEEVGHVALAAVSGQPNRVALRWQLDGQTGVENECLQDYARLGLRNPDAPDNTALSGSWIQPPEDQRYGINVSIFQGSDFQYYEWPYLLTYDTSGAPVWLGASESDFSPPSVGTDRQFDYFYTRSNYTGGLPTAFGASGCSGSGCFSVQGNAGSFERTYLSSATATWTIDVGFTANTGQQIVLKRPTGSGDGFGGFSGGASATVDAIKLTDVNQILVDRVGCTIPAAARSCPVNVDVGLMPGVSANVYRLNVLTQTRSALFVPPSGTVADTLPKGLFRYELRTTTDFSQPPLAQSWIVRVEEEFSGLINTINFGDPQQCTASLPNGELPGAAMTPGAWWNPERNGTGWDLTLIQKPTTGTEQLLAVWYTYDAQQRPVWLYTLPNQIETLPNGERRWWSPLLKYTWSYDANASFSGQPVGEVSLSFPSGDATRAALRWRWNQASGDTQNECVQDFTRAGQQESTANAAFSGPWIEPGWPGYGYQVAIAPIGSNYLELGTVTIYDSQGQPVWLQAQRVDSSPPGLEDSETLTLNHYRSTYPGGYPITTCHPANCEPTDSVAGTLQREFESPVRAQGDLDVVQSFTVGGGMTQNIDWRRPLVPGTTVTLEKIAATSQVLVDRTACSDPCQVQIDFATDPRDPHAGSARLYRRNLDNNAVVAILNVPTGIHTDNIAEVGRYRYELLRWDAPGAPPLAYSAEVVVSEGAGGGTAEEPPPPAPDPGHEVDPVSARTGASRGEFRVDESGALTYSLPIMVMPGSGNMAPELALAYSSRNGAGPLGLGWQISGQSSINRCGTATEHGDAQANPITLTTADQFCLDGQRLKLVSGSHGQTGAVYRLESDQFVRVTVQNVHGSGALQSPSHFLVERKDGTRSTYGSANPSSSARVLTNFSVGSQTIFAWPLSRVADRADNYMDYEYQHGTQGIEYVLSAVKYTGNTSANTGTYAEVRFDYQSLSNVESGQGWVAGARTARTLRMQAIRSLGEGGVLLRNYRLNWSNDAVYHYPPLSTGGRSILTSVAECFSGSAADCLPATTFNWTTGAQTIPAAAAYTPTTTFSHFRYSVPVDLNGDGRQDLVVVSGENGQSADLQVLLADTAGDFTVGPKFAAACGVKIDDLHNVQAIDLNGTGFQGVVYAATKCTAATNNGIYYHDLQGNALGAAIKLVSAPDIGPELHTSSLSVVDWNGDGLADLMLDFPGSGTAAAPASAIGIGEGSEGGNYGPWNPDGARPPVWLYANNAQSLPPGTLQVFDEGVQVSGGFDWLDNSQPLPGSCTEAPQWLFSVELDRAGAFTVDGGGRSAILASAKVQMRCYGDIPIIGSNVLVDLNGTGDGATYTEIVAERHRIFQIEPQTDGSLKLASYADVAEVFGEANYLPTDLNGDGLTDMVTIQTSNCAAAGCNVWVQINTGAGLGTVQAQATQPALTSSLSKHARLVDYNGDGLPDLVYPSNNSNGAIWNVRFWEGAQGAGGALIGRFRPTVHASPTRAGNMDDGWQSQFVDWTGNGLTDHALFRKTGSSTWQLDIARGTVTPPGACTGVPCYTNLHAIRRITDGLGAWTEVDYASLAQRSVYTRGNGGPYLGMGNGAPVYDLIAPMYVIQTARSLAPQYQLNANATGSTALPNGTTLTRYYYTGAKIQAGGRGFLGFREVASYDPQSAMLTRTRYQQEFPYIGFPERTESSYQPAPPWPSNDQQDPLLPCTGSCGNTAISSGLVLGQTVNQWASLATVAGLVHPYLASADVTSYVPAYNASGVVNGRAFVSRNRTTNSSLDAYGNVEIVNKIDYDDELAFVPFATQRAQNTFSNVPAAWKLGMLSCSVVTSTRGSENFTRISSFGYDADTGILTRETVQPTSCATIGSFERNTVHTLNQFGLIETTTTTARAQTTPRQMKRIWDNKGRFVEEEQVYVQGQFRTVNSVNLRDHYGNVLQSTNAQGVSSYQFYDPLGRPHYSYSATGGWSRVVFAPGVGANNYCPTGTALREEHTAAGGMRSTVCKDLLGRETRKVSWTVNGARIYADVHYDYASRPIETSEPYEFTKPSYWTRTVYDEFGRVEFLRFPDGSLQSATYSARETRSTNALGQVTVKVVNAVGETISETVAYGSADQAETTHAYDSLGRLKSTDGPLDGPVDQIQISYTLAGQRTQVIDPDKGTWRYHHNGYGELLCQIDAKGQGVANSYDELGRLVSRRERSGVSDLVSCAGSERGIANWVYDDSSPQTPRFGQLVSDSYSYNDSVLGTHQESHSYSYDNFGRNSGRTTTINEPNQSSVQYTESSTFDEFGRAFQSFDVSGGERGLRYVYGSEGHLKLLREAAPGDQGQTYWELIATDPRGQPTQARLGNGVDVYATYEASTGRPLNLTDSNGQILLQDLRLHWDAIGNLVNRYELGERHNSWETFSYDDRNRLLMTWACIPWSDAPCIDEQSQSYDASGNILHKSDVGTYLYGGPRPHAVTQAGSVTYQYDANGNVSSDSSGRSFHYSLTDQAVRISKGVASSEFHYGIDGQRIVRRDRVNGNVATRTHYVGTVEVYTEDNIRRFRRMIGGAAIATWYESTGVTQLSYLHKDHLGSLVAITDANGTPTAWMNYDPWGQRRSPEHWYPWQPATTGQIAAMLAVTPRGFTGHEHLDAVGVVHMNGRIYDPKLARMLQADPFIEDTGTLNRYTYAHNNPLAFTDPSGYFSIGKFLRTVVSIAISVYTGGAVGGHWLFFGQALKGASAFAAIVGAGAVSGALSSGTIEGAAWGAFSSAVFFGIGQGLSGAGDWATDGNFLGSGLSGAGFATKTISHGLAGGAISRLQGGKFGHGFASAAGSAATAPFADMSSKAGVYQGAVVSTLVGGTLSKLSGGKFANGAVTAAMSYAFNQAVAGNSLPKSRVLTRNDDKSIPANGFISEADAVKAGLAMAKVRAAGLRGYYEYGGGVVTDGTYFWFTEPVTRGLGYEFGAAIETGKLTMVAVYHTHPKEGSHDRIFSPHDVLEAAKHKVTSYIGVYENRAIEYYDPGSMNPGKVDTDGVIFNNASRGKRLCSKCF